MINTKEFTKTSKALVKELYNCQIILEITPNIERFHAQEQSSKLKDLKYLHFQSFN